MDKVIRILATFIVVVAFALCVARRLLFPEASDTFSLPLTIGIIVAMGSAWCSTREKENTKE